MTNINDAIGKQVINLVVGPPGVTRDVEVNDDGTLVAALLADGNVMITVRDPSMPEADYQLIEGPIARFALRPGVAELAVVQNRSNTIDRYLLHDAENVHKIAFVSPSAVGYNREGTLLAAGSTYGNVLVWSLEEDGPPRAIVESQVGNQRIVKVDFGFHCLIVLTERGRCYRVPFHFINIPRVLVRSKAEPRLVAGDGKPFDWNCYAYAHHPRLSLEAFGGECGVLVSQHEILGLCGVKRTGLGRFIHKLSFCPRTGRLVAMGENGVQIWSVHTTVMHERWQVAGDYSKLGRAAAAVKFLEESYTAPEAGLKPLAYAVVGNDPMVFWG